MARWHIVWGSFRMNPLQPLHCIRLLQRIAKRRVLKPARNTGFDSVHPLSLKSCHQFLQQNNSTIGELFEAAIEAMFTSILKPGDVYLDGGANVGRHSLPMGIAVDRPGSVIVIDPLALEPGHIGKIAKGHPLEERLVVHSVALTDQWGAGSFTHYPGESGLSGTFPGPSSPTSKHRSIPVRLETLDRLTRGLALVRFVKLDLEGGEYRALLGAKRLLS